MRISDTRHVWLVVSLLKRRLAERYRGSSLGMSWSILLPLGMLAIYTFFFRYLLGMRWPGDPSATDLEVALRIFLGLTYVNMVGEVLTASTRLVLEQPSYVKKMQFPLPVLAYVLVGSAVVQAVLALMVAALVALVGGVGHPWLLPLALFDLLPLLLWALAATWVLSAVGVYLRDLQHVTPALVTVILFLSPVFYTVTSLPQQWQPLLAMNPLSLPIEGARAMLLGDASPSWFNWLAQLGSALCAAIGARWLFERLQPGFADAI
jgi:lipopolysaccharide transport system permease protein